MPLVRTVADPPPAPIVATEPKDPMTFTVAELRAAARDLGPSMRHALPVLIAKALEKRK